MVTDICQGISIHAPLTGSDGFVPYDTVCQIYFNPRSPHRERQVQSLFAAANWDISIHAPLTGSDVIGRYTFPEGLISIHAPLTGSDRLERSDNPQSTIISIHAPLTGSDRLLKSLTWLYDISIHAPLTGSDQKSMTVLTAMCHFNPRSPHRERQQIYT